MKDEIKSKQERFAYFVVGALMTIFSATTIIAVVPASDYGDRYGFILLLVAGAVIGLSFIIQSIAGD